MIADLIQKTLHVVAQMSYENWVSILLAALAVLLAIVTLIVAIAGIAIALVGIWGIRALRKAAEQKAHEAVTKVVAEYPDATQFIEVHKAMQELHRQMLQSVHEIKQEVEVQHQRSEAANTILDRLNLKRGPQTSNNEVAVIGSADTVVEPAEYQKDAPVDVVSIAHKLGIRVWEMHHLSEGVSGQIWLDPVNGGTSGFSIGVKASEPLVRKRFTIAHELAHYILHRSRLDGGLFEDVMYRGSLSSREETQANQMAADILMPFHLINRLVDQGANTFELIASRLQVSVQALKIRLGVPV